MAMIENIVSVYRVLLFAWGLFGYWFLLIFLFVFFYWKLKTKHKMRYNFKLCLKWLIFLGGTPLPLTIIATLLQLSQPIIIYKQLIVCLEWSSRLFCVFLITYALYKKGYARKYELLLPLFYWFFAVPLLIYKIVQTEQALGIDSDLCKGITNTSRQARPTPKADKGFPCDGAPECDVCGARPNVGGGLTMKRFNKARLIATASAVLFVPAAILCLSSQSVLLAWTLMPPFLIGIYYGGCWLEYYRCKECGEIAQTSL
jgi:hypothetical protein